MEDVSILGLMEQRLGSMSKSHKKIATFALNHVDRAAFMTAAQLGRELSISESTVVRFASGLGLSGYPEFQKELAFCLRERLNGQEKLSDAAYGRSQSEILNSVMLSDQERILKTMEAMDAAEFDAATDLIAKASTVYVCGLRGSEPLARFLSHYLGMIRRNVILITTSSVSEIFEQMLYLSEKDCVIGISFPSHSMLCSKALKFAKDRNAKTIAVTNDGQSPLASLADCKLYARSEMISVVDSLVAPMSVINALVVALALKNPGETRANADRLEEAWKDYQILWNQDSESIET